MALKHRKKLRGPGLPELTAVLLGLAVAACFWMLGKEANKPGWARAPGRVEHCDIRRTHYNAEPSDNKVQLVYSYVVGAARFQGSWQGFWPRVHSPNALPEGNVEVLKTPNYPLVVLYDPLRPSRSDLHIPDARKVVPYTLLTFAALMVLLFYLMQIYPRWKARRARSS